MVLKIRKIMTNMALTLYFQYLLKYKVISRNFDLTAAPVI